MKNGSTTRLPLVSITHVSGIRTFFIRISYSTFLLPGKLFLSSYSHPCVVQEPVSEGSILQPSEREPRGRASSWQRAWAMPTRWMWIPFPARGSLYTQMQKPAAPCPASRLPTNTPARLRASPRLPAGTAGPPLLGRSWDNSRGLRGPRPHNLHTIYCVMYHHSVPLMPCTITACL